MARQKKGEGSQFVRYFGPVLDALRGLGGSGSPEEVAERIAKDLNLLDEVQNELLPSGESRYRNQVHWARFYLVREGLLSSSKRGVWSLTDRGRATRLSLDESHKIFTKLIRIFKEKSETTAATPEPIAERVAEEMGATPRDYRTDVINLLLGLPPAGFERLSQRLLREAGFTQVVVTGSSGECLLDSFDTSSTDAHTAKHECFKGNDLDRSISFYLSQYWWDICILVFTISLRGLLFRSLLDW